jgi:hypothetical protein
LNATWKSQVPTVRARFDAAVPGALTATAEHYKAVLQPRLRAAFTTESEGRTSASLQISEVFARGKFFRVRVFTSWYRARLWELGWRHWRTGVKGERGKRRYAFFARVYKRPVWRIVLFEQIHNIRAVFRHHLARNLTGLGGP